MSAYRNDPRVSAGFFWNPTYPNADISYSIIVIMLKFGLKLAEGILYLFLKLPFRNSSPYNPLQPPKWRICVVFCFLNYIKLFKTVAEILSRLIMLMFTKN